MDGSPTPKDTPRVAREAIRRVFNRNIDELPQLIRVKIQVAALNAQRKGRAAMEVAACAEYRYWHARAGYEG